MFNWNAEPIAPITPPKMKKEIIPTDNVEAKVIIRFDQEKSGHARNKEKNL